MSNNNIAFTVSIKPDISKMVKAMNLSTFMRAEVNRLAASVERYAKQLTPVDTGRLRASISFSPATLWLTSVVSTHTNYAIFVHEGTRYMRARPFMETGAMFAQKEADQGVADRLDKEFVKMFKTL